MACRHQPCERLWSADASLALGQLLLDGWRLRQKAGVPNFTIALCDNLQGNGHQLQALVKRPDFNP